jgi:16S rRNA (adenine1518-N6/adenine1519-N6)-dimethyltransferase
MSVRAKKHLGQHFLKDEEIARKTAYSITLDGYKNVLEIGPGMGMLTKYLLEQDINLKVVELDRESVEYLTNNYIRLSQNIISADFLREDLKKHFGDEQFAIVGNFPYNISSQILFKALEYRDQVPEVTGMFQKELAERVASKHGNKTYGVISVLLQAFYNIEYLFTVHENVFNPPPKVKSAVIRLTRNNVTDLGVDEKKFIQIVKQSFSTRRKTLKNCLKGLNLNEETLASDYMKLRAEQLSVQDFIELTKMILGDAK